MNTGDSVLASDLELTDLQQRSLNACPACIHSLSINASNLHTWRIVSYADVGYTVYMNMYRALALRSNSNVSTRQECCTEPWTYRDIHTSHGYALLDP